jgi:hypothetical protein
VTPVRPRSSDAPADLTPRVVAADVVAHAIARGTSAPPLPLPGLPPRDVLPSFARRAVVHETEREASWTSASGVTSASTRGAWSSGRRAWASRTRGSWTRSSCARISSPPWRWPPSTSRIRLGTGVLVPSNRIPPVTANGLATVNKLAPGRIDFGVAPLTARNTMSLGAMRLADLREHVRVVRGPAHRRHRGVSSTASAGSPLPQPRGWPHRHSSTASRCHLSAFGPRAGTDRGDRRRLDALRQAPVRPPQRARHDRGLPRGRTRSSGPLQDGLRHGATCSRRANPTTARAAAQAGPFASRSITRSWTARSRCACHQR